MNNTLPSKMYLARAGGSGEDEEYALDNGVAIIGFREYPSLAKLSDYASVLALVKMTRPDLNPRVAANHAGQLWAFAVAMQEGDFVVLPRKLTAQLALGRVKGQYKYTKVGAAFRHVRAVEWVRPDAPRSSFGQDLLYSFGAFMTVCTIARNDAIQRVDIVMSGKPDPGFIPKRNEDSKSDGGDGEDDVVAHDLALAARDQIVAHIQSHFREHTLAKLVNSVLVADGWVTKLSPPGPDGGVDILAGRGPFGLDAPRLCVQVKSQGTPADVNVYRSLQGAMQSYKSEQGLLVCWGGFNKVVLSEAKQGHFTVRMWDSSDLVEAIYRTYDKLPPEIQADLPLKRVWMLAHEETES